MPHLDRQSGDYLVITKEQQQQTIDRIGDLLKEQLLLQQSIAKQDIANTTSNEQLFLELLEIFDSLESLIDYFQDKSRLTQPSIERVPKSLGTIQRKLLATLARRQVQIIEATGTELDRDLCQIVDTQINPALITPVVTKVVRRGFKIGEHLLRPVEVTIDAPG
jgi:molecular chaperone GrpE